MLWLCLMGCTVETPPAPNAWDAGAHSVDQDTAPADGGLPRPVDSGMPVDTCEVRALVAAPETPQILILLDRSGSMGSSRWTPARDAVVALTQGLDPNWEVGLALFPSPGHEDEECGVLGLDVFPAAGSANEIEEVLLATSPRGSTPTTGALVFAQEAFENLRLQQPADSLGGPQSIVLVTDGASNCDPFGNIIDSIAATTAKVAELRAQGITTYVIGYDVGGSSLAARAMDDWALEGGTEAARRVRDGETLSAELDAAVAATAPCAFAIEGLPEDPALLRIILDGRRLQPEVDYSVMPGVGISLAANVCAGVRDGGTHAIAAQLLCEPDFG